MPTGPGPYRSAATDKAETPVAEKVSDLRLIALAVQMAFKRRSTRV
jgi:hypothetical protein